LGKVRTVVIGYSANKKAGISKRKECARSLLKVEPVESLEKSMKPFLVASDLPEFIGQSGYRGRGSQGVLFTHNWNKRGRSGKQRRICGTLETVASKRSSLGWN